MSHRVAVETYQDAPSLPQELWEKMRAITDEIRQRAFSLFEKRGRVHGLDLEDWLRAESGSRMVSDVRID